MIETGRASSMAPEIRTNSEKEGDAEELGVG